jgi:hypothetical protein
MQEDKQGEDKVSIHKSKRNGELKSGLNNERFK